MNDDRTIEERVQALEERIGRIEKALSDPAEVSEKVAEILSDRLSKNLQNYTL